MRGAPTLSESPQDRARSSGAAALPLHRLNDYVALALPGIVALPAMAVAGAPVHASPFQCLVAVLIAALAFAIAASLAQGRIMAPLAVLCCGVGAWLLAQASYPVAAWLVAPTVGVGAGLLYSPDAPARALRSWRYAGTFVAIPVAGIAVLALLRLWDRDIAMAAAAAYVALAALLRLVDLHAPTSRRRLPALAAIVAVGLLLPLVTAAYIGATTPRVTWFGDLVSHGPRSGTDVAITFDDGPDPPYTLEIAALLDQYGAKGTFFTVGKALDQRPDVSKALMDDGHLLANHSYSHDAVSWLDPRYPELQQTQDAFQRHLRVCPGFYRPPHGSHTPFIASLASDRGMTMVTWDDSASDWATTDEQLVARRILEGVRPGSIILLHDGSDGNIGAADRSVVLRALPLILDGLQQKGLHPVTLDKLLDRPGYVPCS